MFFTKNCIVYLKELTNGEGNAKIYYKRTKEMVVTTKHTGKNLQELRKSNKKAIVRLLRKKELSGKELADSLHLSPAGIQGLIDEMMADGLLLKRDAQTVVRGRRPINICINPNIGVVVYVTFGSSRGYEVRVCDFNAQVLESVQRGLSDGDDGVALLIEDIKNAVSKTGAELFAIAFSTAGKVHKETGAYSFSPNMGKYVNVQFKSVLEDAFGVGVVVKNSIIYSLAAERKFHEGLNMQNGIYVKDLGCALCIEGRIFEGANGFAGELGIVSIDVYGATHEREYYNPYRSNYLMSMYAGLGEAIWKYSRGALPKNTSHTQAFQLYNEGSLLVKEPVEQFLRVYGVTLRNMVEFMDLEYVVVAGAMSELNDEGLAFLTQNINESIHDTLHVQVVRADPKCTEFKGAFEYAMDIAFNKILG